MQPINPEPKWRLKLVRGPHAAKVPGDFYVWEHALGLQRGQQSSDLAARDVVPSDSSPILGVCGRCRG